jgi:hypothetical protein
MKLYITVRFKVGLERTMNWIPVFVESAFLSVIHRTGHGLFFIFSLSRVRAVA